MKQYNIKIIKKINKIKRKTRDRDIRIKLELFILAHKLDNVTEACYRRGFGRTFYYKWWKRFKKSSFRIDSLKEKSRRPRCSPHKIRRYFEIKILELNSQGYGARMIEALLARKGKQVGRSTISHILNNRKKPCKRKKKALKAHRKRYELPIPGQRVQIDVKYVPKLIRGKRAYCFSAVDECTRIKFSKAYMELSEGTSFVFLDELKKAFPFPIDCIQTDNGFEFTNRFHHNKENWEHSVKIWCKSNGVRHRLIPPGAKELNGKIERSHRIDEQYFYWKAPEFSLEGLNLAMKDWLDIYNKHRPHGGIGYKTPYEKLNERVINLKTEKIEEKLILIKNRFLTESPVMLLELEKPGAYRKFKLAA